MNGLHLKPHLFRLYLEISAGKVELVNNLSSAVVKNTDKTMKIMYTLTEETMLRQFSEMGAAFFMGGGFWHEGILELYSDGFYGCRRIAGLVYGRL